MNEPAENVQPQPDGHQQMAIRLHSLLAQGQGVPISSAQAEQVVEMKLWLAAIANGQLRILDTAQGRGPAPPPGGNGGADPK